MNARPSRRTPRHARPLSWHVAGLTALLAVGTLSACGSTAPTATDPASLSSPASPVSTSAAPASPASSSATSGGQSVSGSPVQASSPVLRMVKVPVYYVMRTPKGARLVAELRPVPALNRLQGAVAALEAQPQDPDYTSYYHPGDLGAAHYDGTRFTAVLTNPAKARRGRLSQDDARIAVQQLAYTLAAAQGGQSAHSAATRVIANGAPTRLFGIATNAGVRPGDQLTTLADINVLSPTDGSTESGTLLAQGLANSPEASVPWKITNAQGTVVKHGSATASGWMDKLYPWSKKIDISSLPAGRYTFAASTDDEADADEGSGASVDTKSFTIS